MPISRFSDGLEYYHEIMFDNEVPWVFEIQEIGQRKIRISNYENRSKFEILKGNDQNISD